MNDFETYIKGILKQISDSYKILGSLSDKPGDLDIIKKELSKVNGLFQVAAKKLDASNIQSDDLVSLQSKVEHYLENYDFMREIETMSKLYSEDPNRLKNIRHTILEALENKKLMEKIQSLIDENNND